MPFPVDGRQIGRAWRPGEAERGSGVRVEPVGQELDAVLRGHDEVDDMRLCDLLRRDARDVVSVHEQWHRVGLPARSETSAALRPRPVQDSGHAGPEGWPHDGLDRPLDLLWFLRAGAAEAALERVGFDTHSVAFWASLLERYLDPARASVGPRVGSTDLGGRSLSLEEAVREALERSVNTAASA